jgi:hypothetical protein
MESLPGKQTAERIHRGDAENAEKKWSPQMNTD